ncbi:MAG TPA: arylsulfatase [Ramlibacter sp.]|nr:arylsulfatase [Ramlibacter sp.]
MKSGQGNGGRSTLPPLQPCFRGHIDRTAQASRPDFAAVVSAPAGAPNVIVVLLDDVGFGQPSTFGGAVRMPTLDALAKSGLRYTQFHTTAMCSPTRAAVLTGRNHHAVASGSIVETATGYPGYHSILPRSSATIAEMLRGNGYATAAFGKWHNTPEWETGPHGPFDRWPTSLGFDYFYGFMGPDCHQFAPLLIENTRMVDPRAPAEGAYHLDADLADRAIAWIREHRSVAPERPFFMYYAPATGHGPHHAPKDWIEGYAGEFAHGWDRERELTLMRQKELGIVPADTVLTPRPAEISAWDSQSPGRKKLSARYMEAFAGMLSHFDDQFGRVMQALEELGERDDTLVVFIAGDNGPSAEGTLNGVFNKWTHMNRVAEDEADILARIDEIGGPSSCGNYPVGWAWAGATPLQWFKQVASHLGGTRNGMVVSWPARIRDGGGLRTQFHHCVDIAPTILEAAGLPKPDVVNGIAQDGFDGGSLGYTFDDAAAPSKHRLQYFEIFGNRALYQDGWWAAARHGRLPWQFAGAATGNFDDDLWELYNLQADFSQAKDLAASDPARLRALQDLWWTEAARNHVLPLDDRMGERLTAGHRPDPNRGRTEFVYHGSIARIPECLAPNLKGRSHRIRCVLDYREGDEGILVSAGGRFGGYALFILGGLLNYSHNLCGAATYTVSSSLLAPSRHELLLRFVTDEPRPGSGGTATLLSGDVELGRGRIERTVPFRFPFTESFNVGRDTGTPVVESYTAPFSFSGKLHRVTVSILSGLDADARRLEAVASAGIERSNQ